MKLATKFPSSFSLLLSVLVLLCGCGGGPGTSLLPSNPTSGGPAPTPPSPPAQGQSISGNWQFSTTSTAGVPSLTIAGSINQSGSSVSGAVHVAGSNCFDPLITVGL